jgi:hypothetical protein
MSLLYKSATSCVASGKSSKKDGPGRTRCWVTVPQVHLYVGVVILPCAAAWAPRNHHVQLPMTYELAHQLVRVHFSMRPRSVQVTAGHI